MPPKKKGKKSGKKGKKSGKKTPKKSASGVAAVEAFGELSKEFFLIQIRDLEERLVRYQRKCDQLELGNNDYKSQFEQQVSDKKEIVSFLKKQLEQRADEIADLQDRLIGLQQAKDAEKDQYEVQLATLRTEMQEIKDQLTSENMVLNGKLASLEEFRVQREDLMAKFAKMEEDLAKQEQDHKEVIYNLERKAVIDKDRLKKEMVLRVNQVAAEFRKVSNKQMAETTKRTIRENVSINTQLAKMSDKTMELIQENDELQSKVKKNKQQLEMLEHNEKELAKKNSSNQKIIRMLTDKATELEEMLADYELREEEYKQLESESSILRMQAESCKEELKTTEEEKKKVENELEKVRKDREVAMKHKEKLVHVIQQAAGALQSTLVLPLVRDSDSEDSGIDEALYKNQRDTLVQTLLTILNGAAFLGVGPQAQDFRKLEKTYGRVSPGPDIGGQIPVKKDEFFGRAEAINKPIPHYKLGDLGIVPRPKPKLDTLHHSLSPTRTGEAYKKPPTRSIGVQTISAQKAMFFADQLLTKRSRSSHSVQSALQEFHASPIRTELPVIGTTRTRIK